MYSSVTYTASSGAPTWSIPFEIIDEDWILMTVDGVSVTTFTVDVGALTVTWAGSSDLLGGETVVIYRSTALEVADEPVTWAPGPVSDADLSLDQKKRRAVEQELSDTVVGMDTHVADSTLHMPDGGETDEFLTKASSITGDTQWVEGLQLAIPVDPMGGIITWDNTGLPYFLEAGTSGQYLKTLGDTIAPEWDDVTGSGLGDVSAGATESEVLGGDLVIYKNDEDNKTIDRVGDALSEGLRVDSASTVDVSGNPYEIYQLSAQRIRAYHRGGESEYCLRLQSGRTGPISNWYVGDTTPEDTITAVPGSVYVWADTSTPTNSSIWIKQGTGTTGWAELDLGTTPTAKSYAYFASDNAATLITTGAYVNAPLDDTGDAAGLADSNWSVDAAGEVTYTAGVGYPSTIAIQVTMEVEVTQNSSGTSTDGLDMVPQLVGGGGDAILSAKTQIGWNHVGGDADLVYRALSTTFATEMSDGQKIRIRVRRDFHEEPEEDPESGRNTITQARIYIREL